MTFSQKLYVVRDQLRPSDENLLHNQVLSTTGVWLLLMYEALFDY